MLFLFCVWHHHFFEGRNHSELRGPFSIRLHPRTMETFFLIKFRYFCNWKHFARVKGLRTDGYTRKGKKEMFLFFSFPMISENYL